MKLSVLVENVTQCPGLTTEAGLSIHIQTDTGTRMLMDFGRHGALVPNAEVMGVSLREVDYGFLSHGHNDHSGGIAAFRKINPAAPIYMQKTAFASLWARRETGAEEFIGVDPALQEDAGLVFCTGVTQLPDGAVIFDGITGRELFSTANGMLCRRTEKGFVSDEFIHEQGLLLPRGSGWVLLSGCAHNGVLNMMARCHEIMGQYPVAVVGGFHLAEPGTAIGYDPERVEQLARRLRDYPTRYFTGHCTGLPAYEILKTILGEQVDYASCGRVIEL